MQEGNRTLSLKANQMFVVNRVLAAFLLLVRNLEVLVMNTYLTVGDFEFPSRKFGRGERDSRITLGIFG